MCDYVKKKEILSITFIVSLLPMLMSQYGGCKGVQEISGMMNLFNPIGILSTVLFVIGVWIPFQKTIVNKILGAVGVIGIVVSEIYTFFTWHFQTITGEISLQNSLSLAYPEFYIGLIVSVIMVIVYFAINNFARE